MTSYTYYLERRVKTLEDELDRSQNRNLADQSRVQYLKDKVIEWERRMREYQCPISIPARPATIGFGSIRPPEPPKPRFTSGGTKRNPTSRKPHRVHYINDEGHRVAVVHDDLVLRDRIIDFLNEEN